MRVKPSIATSIATSTVADAPAAWAPGPQHPSLPGGAIDVWRAELAHADERLTELLSEAERARAARLLSDRQRALWMRSRGLLRALLALYLRSDPRALHFAEDAHGKPRLDGTAAESPRAGAAAESPRAGDTATTGTPRLSFNLSHSRELALYAFCADAPVGVDVESERPTIDETAIAARIFTAQEAAGLREIADPHARRREFLRLWTRYEAQLKCLGVGIGAAAADAHRERLWVAELHPGAGIAAAVACPRAPQELRCWSWPPSS